MTVISLGSSVGIEAALLRSAKPAPSGSSHDREMSWRSPRGRSFEVREMDDGTHFVGEFVPTERVCRKGGGFRSEPRVGALMANPNGFADAAREAGIDPDNVVRTGAGLGLGSVYHPTLRAAAAAIEASVAANRWHDSYDRALLADPAFLAETGRRTAEGVEAWKAAQSEMHDRAVDRGHGIFKGLHSMMGPLGKDARDRILSFLNAPSHETWDAAARLCVKGGTTAWQAWASVDPEAPRSLGPAGAWPRIPDPETFRDALRALGETAPEARAPAP